jgi:hypothetical protein
MLYLPYLEGALFVAAVAAVPVGIRLRHRGLSPRRFVLVRHPDPPKPRPKPNPEPKPEPEAEPEVKPAVFEETPDTEGGSPRIELPAPMSSVWSNDNFRIDTASQIAPGPVTLVFRQRRPIEIDPDIQPAGSYYMYFPIPEGSAFDQQTRLRTGEFGTFQAIPRRAVGLSIAYAVPTYPIPANPAVTGMSTGGFPYYPMSIGQAFTTVNANIGIISVTVINNTSLLLPGGPPRVIAVFYLHDLVTTTVNKTWGRPNSLWIFHTITGPVPLLSTVNVGH